MKADFSRYTFHARRRFTRVLMQQGRVQVDADPNEGAEIETHYLRALAWDLIGPWGGPEESWGFEIEIDPTVKPRLSKGDFRIGAGIYYVDGIRCENPETVRYSCQPEYVPIRPLDDSDVRTYLVYLEAWERLVTHLQAPHIREVALLGPDTAARAKLVWQVKVVDVSEHPCCKRESSPGRNTKTKAAAVTATDAETMLVDIRDRDPFPRLRFRATRPVGDDDPCLTAPDAKYRGENQLYRVEIHQSGAGVEAGREPTTKAPPGRRAHEEHGGGKGDRGKGEGGKPDDCGCAERATFKWSRENGSVVFPVVDVATAGGETTVKLLSLGRDAKSTLEVGDWVELIDDETELQVVGDELDPALRRDPPPLLCVKQVLTEERTVVLDSGSADCRGTHRILRRWDHQARRNRPRIVEGALEVVEGEWIPLEDGVEVFFEPGTHRYRPGDYWMAPARVATGDVEWPVEDGVAVALPPHGVARHYAPLALVSYDPLTPGTATVVDARRRIARLGQLPP